MELYWILVLGLCAPQWWGLSQAGAEFSCDGRGSGYYADVESGCQVYHMCDGLGRQFSYTCPNTTLFQQRMLICDHWYMVNCSKSELDYSANLLIGQRDKPFVDDSSENPYHRTPRPDLETYAPMFRQDYRQGKAQFGSNQNLVGADTDGENTTSVPQYFLPSHWSTQYTKDFTTPIPFKKYKTNEKGTLPEKNTKIRTSFKNTEKNEVITPSRFTLPPFIPTNSFPMKNTPLVVRTKEIPTPPRFTLPPFVTTRIITTTEAPKQKITRTADSQTSVFQGFSSSTPKVDVPNLSKFLLPPVFDIVSQNPENKPIPQFTSSQNEKRDDRPFPRFDPAPQRPKIQEQVLTKVPETREPTPRFNQPLSNKELTQVLKLTQFSTISALKATTPYPAKVTTLPEATPPDFLEPSKSFSLSSNEIEPPSLYYQPPKFVILLDGESTTMDPISFYNLVPSKELEPPTINDRADNGKTILDTTTLKTVTKKQSFGVTERIDDKKWKELRQMFFIPEYDFPLEVASGPSYESGVSSFNVQSPPGVESRSVDKSAVKCDPKCNPAFLTPGTCQPCVMIRR